MNATPWTQSTPLPGDIAMVVADMDGTLLDGDSRIPEGFWPLLARLQRAGIEFVPASGRQIFTLRDMFDDAFTAIARDGAGMVEVSVRLQKALQSLASMGNSEMRDAAEYHARLALGRAELALNMPEDLAAVQDAGMFAKQPGPGPGSGAQGATSADRQ